MQGHSLSFIYTCPLSQPYTPAATWNASRGLRTPVLGITQQLGGGEPVLSHTAVQSDRSSAASLLNLLVTNWSKVASQHPSP